MGRRALERIRAALLAWYATEQRDFPWRSTSDPYAVLVSEVMLQQTQASRVVERFGRFMDRFPTAASLAAAPSAHVLAEWSGLGYNRRAIALQRAAVAVTENGWPRTVEGLERLPGVGPYTARAVASLAFGIAVGVVDTNVRRWLLRRFGGPDRPGDLQAMSDHLAAPGRGADIAIWTHATMELGASVCRPRSPRCDACPIAAGCASRYRGAPVPVPRQPALVGSDRFYRGAILRRLAASDGHAAPEPALLEDVGLDGSRWERVVAGLERDGLVHRRDDRLGLGGARIAP